jgi:hypothetical protein
VPFSNLDTECGHFVDNVFRQPRHEHDQERQVKRHQFGEEENLDDLEEKVECGRLQGVTS